MSVWLGFISQELHCMVTWLCFFTWSPQCQYFLIFPLTETGQIPQRELPIMCVYLHQCSRPEKGKKYSSPTTEYLSSVPLIFILYPLCVCLRETILSSHLLECIVDLWYGEERRSGIPALSKQPYLQQNFHRYLTIPIPGSLFEKFPKISGNFSPFLIAGFLISALSFQTFLAVVSILVYFVFAGLCLSRKKKTLFQQQQK